MNNKIACCISGRPSNQILEHLRFLIKFKNKMDFFIFFWDTIDAQTKNKINTLLQPKSIVYFKPMFFSFDAIHKEPDKKDNKINALSMFFGIATVQQLRQSFEQRTNKKYDLVIRFRYDIHFFSEFDDIIKQVLKIIDNDSLIFPFEYHHIGICDQLWFGRSRIMDKFSGLFDWIKNNNNKLFFVNENVLYKFIESQKINIKCSDIKYVLRRDNFIGSPHHFLWSEYLSQRSLPWILSCIEKKEKYYQAYISSKNESANNIFFFTKEMYIDVPCKLLNCVRNKYLHVSEENYYCGLSGKNIFSHFIIKHYNSFLINIIVNNPVVTHGTLMCLTVHNNKLICTSNIHDCNSQFMLLKQDENYCFAQNRSIEELSANPEKICINGGKFIYMNKNNDVFTDGDKQNPECEWNILKE
jgi:hypothetical protein